MTKKLVIHIGSHKTGTTSIQKSLCLGAEALSGDGFFFFRENSKKQLIRNGNAGCWINFNKNKKRDFCKINIKLADRLAESSGDVIVSSESFSWVVNPGNLKKFKKRLSSGFSEIKIVVYIRRQDKHIISHHQQGSKFSGSKAREFYGNEPVAIPSYKPKFDDYLDYYSRLSMWGDIFGDDNIIIRPFERAELIDGDVVADFSNVIQCASKLCSLNENITSGYESSKIGHLMHAMDFDGFQNKSVLRYLNNSGKLLPSRQEAEGFYMRYKESNRLLNQRFNVAKNQFIFDDEFSMYPDIGNGAWTDAAADNALRNILKAFVIDGSDYKMLQSIANTLKNGSDSQYLDLLKLMNKLNPRDGFVKTEIKRLL